MIKYENLRVLKYIKNIFYFKIIKMLTNINSFYEGSTQLLKSPKFFYLYPYQWKNGSTEIMLK